MQWALRRTIGARVGSSEQEPVPVESAGMAGSCNGEHKLACRALRGGDGSRHSRCRFRVLQKPILGTADSEYWHCLGVRSFLLEIPQASMNKAR